jgi:hypothetical protein
VLSLQGRPRLGFPLRLRRNDWLHTVFAQPLANPLGIVATISCQPFRTSAGARSVAWQAHLLEHGFDLGRLVTLPWRQTRIQRQPVAITEEVDLGREAADGASKGMVGWLATGVRSPFFRAPPRRGVLG